jgi:hypothetical protein
MDQQRAVMVFKFDWKRLKKCMASIMGYPKLGEKFVSMDVSSED